MRTHTPKRKLNSSILWIAIAVLLVVELCSVSVLFSQVLNYSDQKNHTVINLTEGGKQSILTVTDKNGNPITNAIPSRYIRLSADRSPAAAYTDENPLPNSDKTGFGVHDEDKVWSTVTDVEIFHLTYDDNGDGHITTASSDSDKVFAPGTTNTYPFTLTNTGKYNLKYRLTVEAYYEGTDGQWIPIEGRFFDYNNEYIVGSADSWPDVLELNKVDLERRLAPNSQADYTLQWRWPFERGDVIQEGLYKGDYTEDFYDTMLGNRAVDEDLILHVIIRTWTEIDEETPQPTPPDTGDANNLLMWAAIALLALVLLIVLLIVAWKNRKKEQDEKN